MLQRKTNPAAYLSSSKFFRIEFSHSIEPSQEIVVNEKKVNMTSHAVVYTGKRSFV